MIAFGPIPSRRLGRSLGINNIPPKVCTYPCVYCQAGRTTRMRVERQAFYEPERVLADVRDQVASAIEMGEPVDYLTFVSDGEPTLDVNLGREIELLKPLGFKIAVITNGSTLWREDARESLTLADWVSVKVDSVREQVWRRIDRPHGALRLDTVLDGLIEFAGAFGGELVTETMLVEGVNDGASFVGEVADFVARLGPCTAYLSLPTRPPAEEWVRSPGEQAVNRAYQIIGEKIERVEVLSGYEGDAFAFTGDVENDLLSITAVHPMREQSVNELLARAGAGWAAVHRLIAQGQLVEVEYEGRKFYVRKLYGRQE